MPPVGVVRRRRRRCPLTGGAGLLGGGLEHLRQALEVVGLAHERPYIGVVQHAHEFVAGADHAEHVGHLRGHAPRRQERLRGIAGLADGLPRERRAGVPGALVGAALLFELKLLVAVLQDGRDELVDLVTGGLELPVQPPEHGVVDALELSDRAEHDLAPLRAVVAEHLDAAHRAERRGLLEGRRRDLYDSTTRP